MNEKEKQEIIEKVLAAGPQSMDGIPDVEKKWSIEYALKLAKSISEKKKARAHEH